MEDFIIRKWTNKVWTIPGHPFVEVKESGTKAVEVPRFEVCQIRAGALVVSASAIDTFAGTNVVLKAKLLQEAEKADQDFAHEALTIGATPKAKVQEVLSPIPLADVQQGPPPAKRSRTSTWMDECVIDAVA